MKARHAFGNMNSDRALFLILWTLCVVLFVGFVAGWMLRASDVFWPSSYGSVADFTVFWTVLLTPYPLLLVLPPIRARFNKHGS